MHRGALAIACNLGTEAVDVPVSGEVVLAWGEPTVDAKSTRMDGHSFAFCRLSSRYPQRRGLWITHYRRNADR